MDIAALEVLHEGFGSIIEECNSLRDYMRRMRLKDTKHDKGLYGRMFGLMGSTGQ